MGIKRCPYCRSLIEEGEMYCRHCGTQLLFPEDELVEEDIPGEKIIFEEEREFEKQEEELALEEMEGEGGKLERSEEELASEEEMKRKNSPRDRVQEEGWGGEEKEEKEWKPEQIAAENPEGEGEEEEEEEEEERQEIIEETAKPGEPSLEELRKSLRFSTEELDRITRSVDDARKEVEEFLLTLKEKAEGKGVEETGEKESDFRAPGEEAPPLIQEENNLPPWADALRERVETEPESLPGLTAEPPRGFSFTEEGEEEKGEAEAGVTPTLPAPTPPSLTVSPPPSWQADSGVGLPEKPARQQPLPFGSEAQEERMPWTGEELEKRRATRRPAETKKTMTWQELEEEEEEEEVRKEGEVESEEEFPREKAPSRSFMAWLKAKIFDLVFVGLLWFVAFVLAARMVAVPFFSLVASSLTQAAALFLILLVGYFFLFRFFIGETLGDRLFSPGD